MDNRFDRKPSIAMYGGSFNPPHTGHVAVASHIMREYAIDDVLFVVAADPPHKEIADGVDSKTRFAMTCAALDGSEQMKASDIELVRGGKSYTALTLMSLHEEYPAARLYLLVGEDMLENLPTWYDTKSIFALAEIIAVSRPGFAENIRKTAHRLQEEFGARVSVAEFEGPDISSTSIRERVRRAQTIHGMTPDGTEDIIYSECLYQPEYIRKMADKLRSEVKPSRYRHSLGVMRCAIDLAARFGLDGEKARVAGLLHDCAKLPDEKLIKLAEEYGVAKDAYDEKTPSLLHDRVGAYYAAGHYGVKDAEIFSAIAVHTRGQSGMSAFDKLIYLADKIEPTRDYPGVDALRAAAREDLDTAVLMCMENVVKHLESTGEEIQPNIFEAINELRGSKNKRRKSIGSD